MHTYGGITPLNVWDIDMDVLRLLVNAAVARNTKGSEAGGGQ